MINSNLATSKQQTITNLLLAGNLYKTHQISKTLTSFVELQKVSLKLQKEITNSLKSIDNKLSEISYQLKISNQRVQIEKVNKEKTFLLKDIFFKISKEVELIKNSEAKKNIEKYFLLQSLYAELEYHKIDISLTDSFEEKEFMSSTIQNILNSIDQFKNKFSQDEEKVFELLSNLRFEEVINEIVDILYAGQDKTKNNEINLLFTDFEKQKQMLLELSVKDNFIKNLFSKYINFAGFDLSLMVSLKGFVKGVNEANIKIVEEIKVNRKRNERIKELEFEQKSGNYTNSKELENLQTEQYYWLYPEKKPKISNVSAEITKNKEPNIVEKPDKKIFNSKFSNKQWGLLLLSTISNLIGLYFESVGYTFLFLLFFGLGVYLLYLIFFKKDKLN
jgi:hypothetical protein